MYELSIPNKKHHVKAVMTDWSFNLILLSWSTLLFKK